MTNILWLFIIINFIIVFYLYFFWWASYLYDKKANKKENTKNSIKICTIIPAYNEEKTIERCLNSLFDIDYPLDLVDIYVILDHCTDNTEDICKKYDISILHNNYDRGKGKALEFAFKNIKEDYDVYFILDADCVVESNLFTEIAREFNNGKKIVQFPVKRANIDNPFVAFMSIGYYVQDFHYFKGKVYWNLPVFLSGTGFGFAREVLPYFIQRTQTLAEDLEFSLRLIENNIKPTMNFQSGIVTIQPEKPEHAETQQVRWASGALQVILMRIGKAIKNLFRQPGIVSLDLFLGILSWQRVYLVILNFLVFIFFLLFLLIMNKGNLIVPLLFLFLSEIALVIYIFSGIVHLKSNGIALKILKQLPHFIFWTIKVKIKSIFKIKNKIWERTVR